MKRSPFLLVLVGLGGVAGCSSGRIGQVPAAPGDDSRPAALVNGRAVSWEQLKPGLAELAGGQVLEEVVLDELLERRCAEERVVVGPDQIATERALLIDSLDASKDRAEELLRSIRASRKMGEARFAGALRRSAMLRALVGENPAMVAGEVAMAAEVRRHERAVVRIITSVNEAEAAAARARVLGGVGGGGDGPVDAMRFATVAAEVSRDESAARGGMFGEVSAVDSGLSAALREAVGKTKVGHVTPVIATGVGFIVAYVESRLPAQGALSPEEMASLTREVRVRAQRRAMEQLARQMLGEAEVVPMDRALGWGWAQRGK